ncbi:uncharacterized protein B0I36DRAFT_365527 [Microdochium trichocladiopsis]|uniref:Effector 5 n=1 Tax=Microdochium trichocladiopsis TaxID=1682393 RepID=A0A9P8XZA9_9PEZI|nr:uncharacterized protein B0I36DRAFT_365527 [Microdochium trichocladiopsis]KAH7025878.1 hypothetical protein B0I36DRAFT_365527 [Microdochium trichocladiopsis]
MIANTAVLFGLLGAAAAGTIPNAGVSRIVRDVATEAVGEISAASFSCGSLASGLSKADCDHMSNIGMAGQGVNSKSSSGKIWIGTDGANQFIFKNTGAGPPLTVIVWDFPAGDYEASFMNVRKPKIAYSLPNVGDSVTVSVGNGVSGAFSFLANHKTVLSQYGQIYNTWGEFTTGDYATVDVSRLVNTRGNPINIKVQKNGCVSNMDKCVFQCKNSALTFCGESGSYNLVNCENGSQSGASKGTWDGINPEGGCQGWSNGGKLEIGLVA